MNPRSMFVGPSLALIFSSAAAMADLSVSHHAPDIADLSGERGDRIDGPKEVSRGKAGIGLMIISRGGVSCGVALEGRTLGVNGNFEKKRHSRCRSGEGRNSEEALDLSYRAHMIGFRICTSRDAPVHIGGFEIAGGDLDEAGHIDASETRRYSSAGCDRWGDWSMCAENSVVTGFVAHFDRKERGNEWPDALVGLQAVCREIIKK